ncbi:MAG TPA: aminotransferase class V-fold PLP-dependent enzyme [Ohtaekwangia sp.]|nr:aminotransferase class V-fold PLP-dependent enzyme [Ohtaekwangia sp.]
MNTNFTPGPSQLYFTVEDHVRTAFKEGIPSLSHRSKKFETIYREATDGLRELLSLPADYQLYFTGSATEIWERIIQNLVEEKSHHLVNGSFSKRFFEIAQQVGKKAEKSEVAFGKGFGEQIQINNNTELIAVTHNETSTGVSMPLNAIYKLKEAHPEALLAVDAVSSLPFPDFNYNLLDTVFFSVQKAFGLPAGLGVWMVNEKCIAKAELLLNKGLSIGSYHNIPSLQAHAVKYQTPETPNVLSIYLLSKVVEDMLRRGISTIRKETEYKATLLYQALENHSLVKPFVQEKVIQSKTVIVADCGDHTERITKHLQTKGMHPGSGYGSFKKSQLRFANFPTHSKEHYELLVDSLKEIV